MARVTQEDIIKINEIYYKVGTYAETARQTGFSPATVKRYVIADWRPVEIQNITRFKLEDIPNFDSSIFKNVDNYGDLCELSESEKEELYALWEELSI